MSYNTDLKTNNTSLQDVLTSIQNLSSGRSYNTETWELTMEDGSIVEEEVKTVPIITFNISSVTYQAIEGMTWGEWVNSEFNNAEDPWCVVDNAIIENSGGDGLIIDGFVDVKPEDVIKNGCEYDFSGYFDF